MQYLTSLQYYSRVKKLTEERYVDDLRPSAKTLLSTATISDLPHLLLYGKSGMINNMYLRQLLCKFHNCTLEDIDKHKTKQTYETSVQQVKTLLEYDHHHFFFEIDISSIHTSAERIALCDLIRSLADHTPLLNKRTVIILRNVEALNDNVDYALKNILERFSISTWFILTALSVSYVATTIKSRCMQMNINLKETALFRQLVDACRPELLEDPTALLDIIRITDNDPVNLIMLLELPSPTLYHGHLFGYMEAKLTEMCQLLKNKDTTLTLYSKLLRETCIRLTAAGIPINVLCKHIIEFCKQKYPRKLQWAVHHLADMEHSTHIVNKTIFVLEQFVDIFVHEIITT